MNVGTDPVNAFSDYLELVDWTGRALCEDKRGAIAANIPPALERLQIDPRYWLYMAEHFESRFNGWSVRPINSKQPANRWVIDERPILPLAMNC